MCGWGGGVIHALKAKHWLIIGSPYPRFNHTLTLNETQPLRQAGSAMPTMLIRLNKIPPISFMAAFCHIIALHLGPQH